MYEPTEKQKEKFKELDKQLDKQLLEIFGFDKCDVINLTKEEFRRKMMLAKLAFNTCQMKGLYEGFKNIKW